MGIENYTKPSKFSLCGNCSSVGECKLARAINQIVDARGGEINRRDNRAIKSEADRFAKIHQGCPNKDYVNRILR